MEEWTTIDTYTLAKTRIILNEKNSYHSCLIDREATAGKEGEKPNVVTLAVTVVIREALNHCLKRKAELMKVWIRNKCISVNLLTREGVFSFATMNYSSFLEALPASFSDKLELTIQNLQTAHQATTVTFKLHLHQDGKTISDLVNNNQICVEFGNAKVQESLRFEVAAFSLTTALASSPAFGKGKFENRFDFIDGRASMPLGAIQSPAQIYESMGVEPSIAAIEELIGNLPVHEAPTVEKDSKLYLCHDMKGGYTEDLHFENSLPVRTKPEGVDYRSLHLEQAEIFNYFSHHNITIPPLHWRLACRRAHTKCLGTFIIEKNCIPEATLCSQEFALLLVGVARRCGFDGYLLNIETRVGAVGAFKRWLGFLTQKLHQYVPNSTLIWYDSISQRDGVIRYQNALTEENIEFYRLTDGLFTNYWWNEQLLRKTVATRSGDRRRVYVGNDCFGRGTFGGGMYGTYKAVNKILQHKDELAVALFAPGFTYQDGAEADRRLFHLNELALYKGIKTQVIPVDKWKMSKADHWKREGDWTATCAELCERSALFNFPPLEKGSVVRVEFMAEVMGTAPITESPFKVVLQVMDQSGAVLQQSEAHNFSNYRKTCERPQQLSEAVTVNEELVGSNPYGIKVVEMGKCAQNWAGHYGPRFRGERVYVLIYEKERHWTSKFPVVQPRIGEPYHSLCSSGCGDKFHFLGAPLQHGYNFLADLDLPHTHIINHPFETELSYEHAFIGGSSLAIKRDAVKLLKVLIPRGLDLKRQYFIQVAVRDTPSVLLNFKYISKNEQDRIFSAKQERVEEFAGWKRFTFRLVSAVGEVKADVRSIIDIISTCHPYFLGEIKFFEAGTDSKTAVACTIEASRDFLPTNNYYLNIILRSTAHRRLLVIVQGYAAFAYFQAGTAILGNIPVGKCESFNVRVIDVDGPEQVVVRERVVESGEVATLIMQGSLEI